jgi:DNA-binding NtrC family response regulator/tetratricopeptide (TPR) repeat protein
MRLDARYQVLRRLGRGGTGEVFLVRDDFLQKDLALKLFRRSVARREGFSELEREFQLLSRIDHAGIARAYDFGTIRGRPYFTRDFVAGTVLADALPIRDPERLLSVALGLAQALAYLHRGGIIHLDVKPANVVLPADSGGASGVLIDFGLFRRRIDDPAAATLRGSLPYMAPEYFADGTLGPWTDVYALGATLYQAATGSLPRATPTLSPRARRQSQVSPPALRRPSELNGVLPSALDAVVLKCLALDPSARFASAEEVVGALSELAGKRALQPRERLPAALTVGRDAELARLDALLASLLACGPGASGERDALVLVVTGATGMGQTHLLRELKLRAQTQGLRVHLETGYLGRPGTATALFGFLGENIERRARRRWERFLGRLRRPRSAVQLDASDAERRLRWSAELSLAVAALRRPVVLAVDGLQHCDEIAIALITELAQVVARPERSPSRIGLVLGYREEGPFAAALRELSAILLDSERAVVLALRALDPLETLTLYRDAGGAAAPQRSDLALFHETGGCPARILDFAERGAGLKQPEPSTPRPSVERGGALSGLDRASQELLGTLTLLRRPATVGELSRLLRVPRRLLEKIVHELHRAALAEPVAGGPERGLWVAAKSALAAVESLDARTPRLRQQLHLRIARSLVSESPGDDDPRLLESVHHWVEAGARREVVKYGMRAARYLKSTFQHRAARDVLESVLRAVPPHGVRTRIEAALELAEVHARLGDYDEGLRRLRTLVPAARRVRGPWLRRVLLRLGSLHSRRGDFRRADALFREGLGRAGAARSCLPLRERIEFLNEHAAMKVFSGDYEGAAALCDQGLERVERGRSLRLREVALNLYATRANVALRTLRIADAVRDLERSLELAAAIGSLANHAVILNNLGVAYAESDRLTDAVRTFHEAERACLDLDEGPSLTFVYGNLAVLHAKLGDFRAMDRALAEGERWLAPLGSDPGSRPEHASRRRQALFFAHHSGLAWLYRGRFARARSHFESAVPLAEGIGDGLVARVGEVYRAECLLFEGRYAPACETLERLVGPNLPPLVRRLALPRLALLQGLFGRTAELEAALAEEQRLGAAVAAPFVAAWADVFVGWALSLAGRAEEGGLRLERAEAYFRARRLQPALSVLQCVRAESWILVGDACRALAVLEALPAPAGDLAAVLHPVLLARALLEAGDGPQERARAADAVASGLATMVGNPLLEWELRLEAVRARLFDGDRKGMRAALDRVRVLAAELARGLPLDVRQGLLERGHWKSWSAALPGGKTEVLRGSMAQESPQRRSPERRRGLGAAPGPQTKTPPSTETVSLAAGAAPPRAAFVARSSAMKDLIATLDRLRQAELPVLILGEVGSGKELVARVIHAESRRRAGPFVVVDAAAIPGLLLEAELFGACAGAFTSIEEDRPGLLTQADGGTVLVDHLSALSVESQAKLLRVLADGKFRPLGGLDERCADVRFLFTSEKDPEDEVLHGRLRPDLYYRLRVLVVKVPPLRERAEDLPGLVKAFLAEGGKETPRFAPDALAELRRLPFEGNVRELKNLVARLRIEHPLAIDRDAVRKLASGKRSAPLIRRDVIEDAGLDALKERVEREYVLHHLERLEGDTQKLAALLGVGRKQLYRRCRQLGIRLREVRKGRGKA